MLREITLGLLILFSVKHAKAQRMIDEDCLLRAKSVKSQDFNYKNCCEHKIKSQYGYTIDPNSTINTYQEIYDKLWMLNHPQKTEDTLELPGNFNLFNSQIQLDTSIFYHKIDAKKLDNNSLVFRKALVDTITPNWQTLPALNVFQSAPVVVGTPWWIAIYGSNVKLDGNLLSVGDSIKCYDPQGVYCGVGVIQYYQPMNLQVMKYLPIYGDDPFSKDKDEGANTGDTITFKIILTNKHTTVSAVGLKPVVWGHGSEWYDEPLLVEVTDFASVCTKDGDVNSDGVVNLADLQYLLQYLNGVKVSPFCKAGADMNHDGKVTMLDLSTLVDLLIGK